MVVDQSVDPVYAFIEVNSQSGIDLLPADIYLIAPIPYLSLKRWLTGNPSILMRWGRA